MEIAFSLSISAIIAAIFSLIGTVFSVFFTTIKQGKHDKEMLILKQKLESYENREINYENRRYNTITSYLQKAGTFLFDPDSKEAASEFGKSVGEIFMYIPNEKKELVKGLNSLIADIITAPVDNDDGSCEHRTQLIDQATDIYYMLCENFSDLGVKKPSSAEDQ